MRYECRKCAHRFNEAEIVTIRYLDGHNSAKRVCPLCKTSDFVRTICAYCDFYKSRDFPCGMGHRTIVPYNCSCLDWKIRSKDKPKVI